MKVQKNEKNYFEDMIEEIDQNKQKITFKTSDLINIICNYFNYIGENIMIDYNNFGKKYSIPKIICQNTIIKNYIIHKEIYYKGTKLLLIPIKIDFIDLNRKITTYLIYNESFVHKIITSLQFQNPVIIVNKKEYPYEKLGHFFHSIYNEFKIEDKKIIDYESLFKNNKKVNINLGIKIETGLDLSENFKYYFKYPNPKEEFHFIPSWERSSIFSRDYKNKIIGFCGPEGIGKSTTLLGLLKIKSNYCYLNLKALKDAEDHIYVWRDQILLSEIAYTMRNNNDYKMFLNLKNNVIKYSYFWDAIINIIEYFIKNKIKIKFIFDQYKEKIDPNYKYIKKIKKILEKNDQDIVNIIISSSINDKEVRNSLLSQWIKEDINNIIYYIYLNKLIDITNIINNDNSLTQIQKNMIINEFNSIPKFYYEIRNLKGEKELNNYRNLQTNKIRKSFNDFFSESDNILVGEKFEILLNLRSSFGNRIKKENFKKLLKLLPFKYFIFDIKEYIVNFSFPLVKNIFEDFLSNEISKFLKIPIPSLKEGIIGSIFELNLVNDLRNNLYCKFDQIIKVNNISDLNEINCSKILEENKSILILQNNNEARYIDFTILSDQENLLFYRCKKTFKSIHKNPITKKLINENILYLKQKYEKYFNIHIKKIFLFYVIGITFFIKDKKLNYITWGGNKNEDFKNINKFEEYANSELLLYDIVNRKIFYQYGLEFSEIGDIIEYANKFSSPVQSYINKDAIKKKQEIFREKYNEFDNLLSRIIFNDDIAFFNPSQKAFLERNYPEIGKNKIDYYLKKPKYAFLNQKRMLGFKQGDDTYIFVNKNKIIKKEDNKNYSKSSKKNEEKIEKRLKRGIGKGGKNIKAEKEGKEGKKEEIEEIRIEYEQERVLMLVKDNELIKVEEIKPNFYENLDYTIVFKNNISL